MDESRNIVVVPNSALEFVGVAVSCLECIGVL